MGSRLGPCLILQGLGQGGTGAVYKARDTRLDRTVALEVLLPDAASDEVQRARFEREARAISRLGHPHVGRFDYPSGWSPDGRWLVFSRLEEGTQYDLWLRPAGKPREPVPSLRTPFDENMAAISPDRRWLAYDSDESGTPETDVTSFPRPGAKYRVSTQGGYRAQWSQDGRQLFIWTSAGMLGTTLGPVSVVDVRTTPTFEARTPRRLFTPPRNIFGLSPTRDLQRFPTTVPVEGWTPTIAVTLNWQSAPK